MIPAAHHITREPIEIEVDGVVLNRPDDNVECIIETLSGWRDSPGVKEQGADRPNAHGAYTEQVLRSSRLIGVEGICFAANRGAMLGKADELAALLSKNTSGTLTVFDPDQGDRWCHVTVAGEVLIELLGDTHFIFRFDVIAPDPIKYGPTQRSVVSVAAEASGGLGFDLFTDDTGGSGESANTGFLEFGEPGTSDRAIIANHGTAATIPSFTVSGPCDGFEIHESVTGSSIVYTEPIPKGATVSISTEGIVLLDKVADRSAFLTRRQWWTLPPGAERTVSLIATGGPATLTVSYNSGWW